MMTEKRNIVEVSFKPEPFESRIEEEVALDEPVCIFVNGEYHATLITTPDQKRELALGYLLTSGVITSIQDVKSISFRGKDVFVELWKTVDLREASINMMNLIVTSCGSRIAEPAFKLLKIESRLTVDAEVLLKMFSEVNKSSRIHLRTGGTHSALLCSGVGEIQAFAEDVGRHNAVDKVIGSMLIAGKCLRDCMLVTSGRLSGEIVQKAVKGGIPIVASLTVPLASGIKMAESARITLISLSKGRLKIYTNPERIRIPKTERN
ncbi:formate dehydrogenase accessory sulfurtransferase FdhD [Candidatus Bathyarchaeota archaeon]|nr:formate dehydrogenase accessory sulfurtransferase FdhD [Candidatus Bathyarchaeota archaeon]MBS7630038.1 formate dehydrogenase accessory sulfurtransferase FdhD [Candidatus Bathyarchaeota archaeon]